MRRTYVNPTRLHASVTCSFRFALHPSSADTVKYVLAHVLTHVQAS